MNADQRLLLIGAYVFHAVYFAGALAVAIAERNMIAALLALAGTGASGLAYGSQAVEYRTLVSVGVLISWVLEAAAWIALLSGGLLR